MAGFDFAVAYNDTNKATIRNGLQFMQVHAKYFRLVIHFSAQPKNATFSVTVDGPMLAMYVLPYYLQPRLTYFMQGARLPQASKALDAIFGGYLHGLKKMDEFQASITQSLNTALNIRSTSATLLFKADDPSVSRRVNIFQRALILFMSESLDPEMFLEEFHGVIEFLMGRILGRSAVSLSYGEQARELYAQGIIGSEELNFILRHKDKRKAVKHHGQFMNLRKAEGMIYDAVHIVHLLLDALNNSGATSIDQAMDSGAV